MQQRKAMEQDTEGVYRCLAPRRKHPHLECAMTVARPTEQGELVVRCKSCKTDHIFKVNGGLIVYTRSRFPDRPTDHAP